MNELIGAESARNIFNQVRGLSPMAGAYTLWNEETFKVWGCQPLAGVSREGLKPGTVIETSDSGIVVQTGEGALLLTRYSTGWQKSDACS